jgi:hypothetical protein
VFDTVIPVPEKFTARGAYLLLSFEPAA